jgi:large subunit ribosomal protein L18e
MISKNKIKKRTKSKSNNYLVDTINLSATRKEWREVAKVISGPSSNYTVSDLRKIDKVSKEGDTLVVAGKVLGSGSLSKKVRICALNFSDSAYEKIKFVKGEPVMLIDEIKKNPKAEGVIIVR